MRTPEPVTRNAGQYLPLYSKDPRKILKCEGRNVYLERTEVSGTLKVRFHSVQKTAC